MKRWLEPAPITVPDVLREAVGGHPLIGETLARRGIITPTAARAFLDPAAYTSVSPFDLPDMDRAVERIQRAIRQHEVIGVWGDFDVDGQTSTALLVSSLREAGAQVIFHIPNRLDEGHGIKLPNLQRLIDQGIGLILTCDTGISEHQAIDYANSHGIDVVITDHHTLTPELPNAYAIVNPQRLNDGHPLRNLPGVGVAYKLIEGLHGDTPALLDLVALGIVADVAQQRGDTRYLLQRGLENLRKTERLGLQALIELAEVDPAQISEETIGFALAPRLNALGRLEDANLAVELLTTHDVERARVLASRLEALNNQRRLLVEQVYSATKAQIAQDDSLLDSSVIVLAHPTWHSGVVGIVANRLVEEYGRPVILLVAPEDEPAHGSARSIDGVNITEALAANANLLDGFGGHAGAAGLRLPQANIKALRRALARTVTLPESDALLRIDDFVTLPEITLDLAADLGRLAPFGAGNPPLVLAVRDVHVSSQSVIGRSRDHTWMMVEDQDGNSQRVIWWQSGSIPQGRIDLALSVHAGDYKGEHQLQIAWVDSRPAEGVLQIIDPTIRIIDYRDDPNPLARLRELGDVIVWREVDPMVEGSTRQELVPTAKLAIWTLPPSGAELQAVMEWVKPETVYLFAHDPVLDALEPFMKRLAGLVKYTLSQREGLVTLATLAAATAQREVTVRAGLDWLAARGQIALLDAADGTITITASSGQIAPDAAAISDRLTTLLRETAAYRAFFRRADPAKLIAE